MNEPLDVAVCLIAMGIILAIAYLVWTLMGSGGPPGFMINGV